MGEFIILKLLFQTQDLATVQELILQQESHGLLWPQWHVSELIVRVLVVVMRHLI